MDKLIGLVSQLINVVIGLFMSNKLAENAQLKKAAKIVKKYKQVDSKPISNEEVYNEDNWK